MHQVQTVPSIQPMNPAVKSTMNLILGSGWAATLYIVGLIVTTVMV